MTRRRHRPPPTHTRTHAHTHTSARMHAKSCITPLQPVPLTLPSPINSAGQVHMKLPGVFVQVAPEMHTLGKRAHSSTSESSESWEESLGHSSA